MQLTECEKVDIPYGFDLMQDDEELRESWIQCFIKAKNNNTLPPIYQRQKLDVFWVIWPYRFTRMKEQHEIGTSEFNSLIN